MAAGAMTAQPATAVIVAVRRTSSKRPPTRGYIGSALAAIKSQSASAFPAERGVSVTISLDDVTEDRDRPDRPVLPDSTSDEDEAGWGERPDDRDPDDVQRFLDEKPPHHVD